MKTLLTIAITLFTLNAWAGSCTGYGNTVYCSDGTTYQNYGNTTYGSDGTTWQKYENTYYNNRGTACTQYGNTMYCQ